MDREVRALRDAFLTVNYSKLLYNGLYFSPEVRYDKLHQNRYPLTNHGKPQREFLENSIVYSQKEVNGEVR